MDGGNLTAKPDRKRLLEKKHATGAMANASGCLGTDWERERTDEMRHFNDRMDNKMVDFSETRLYDLCSYITQKENL